MPRESQTSILSPPRSFAYSVAPGNCGGAAGRRRRGRARGGEGEPPGQRSPRAPGPAEGATMLWRHHHRPSQRLSHTHLRSRFPFMELGGVLRARKAPATGGRRRCRERRGATGTLTRPRGGVATASSQELHSESSRQEEPPSGGSTRLGERKEKREARGELRTELASPAAAYAAAAPPRLRRRRRRRRRRPPWGPPPEARWRQFRCRGSPDVQASPLRPKPCGRDVGADAAGAEDAGEVLGGGAEPGRSLGTRSGARPPPVLPWVMLAQCNPEGRDSSHHSGADPCLPATSRRAVELTWGGAYLERGW